MALKCGSGPICGELSTSGKIETKYFLIVCDMFLGLSVWCYIIHIAFCSVCDSCGSIPCEQRSLRSRRVGRIRDSYPNPRLRLGFA